MLNCIFVGTDACALPVLTPKEARSLEPTGASFPLAHPQVEGSKLPRLAPAHLNPFGLIPGEHTREILEELKLNESQVRQLALDGALGDEARLSLHPSHKL